jgi:hypothetical protein
MKPSLLLGVALSGVVSATHVNATSLACEALNLAFHSKVFYPGDANYVAENHGKHCRPGCQSLQLGLQIS